jgi:hypothetical protein
LQEPSGVNAAGEPIALNFATGEPDAYASPPGRRDSGYRYARAGDAARNGALSGRK